MIENYINYVNQYAGDGVRLVAIGADDAGTFWTLQHTCKQLNTITIREPHRTGFCNICGSRWCLSFSSVDGKIKPIASQLDSYQNPLV